MEKIVLDNVTYENMNMEYELHIDHLIIPEGSFFCLYGENEDEKLDILKLCSEMKSVDDGNVTLNISEKFGKKERFRFVPEDILFETNMTGEDYLNFCRKQSNRYGEKIEKALCKKIFQTNPELNLLEMTYQENKLMSLIGAISARPDILFLDRPETYLDKGNRKELYKTLKEFAKKGMTVVISTKNYNQVMEFCTNYAFIDGGKVIQTGSNIKKREIPKIVTIINPKNKDYEKKFTSKIYEKGTKYIFLYKETNMKKLSEIIESTECDDFYVEQMPFDKWMKNDMGKLEE
jgi:ABC-2 type transport system ATP-binding protein